MYQPATRVDPAVAARRRRAQRDAVDLSTIATRDARSRVEIRIVDISPFGFHARSLEDFTARNERIRVILPIIGDVPARVKWGLKGCFGAEFVLPIDGRTYPRLLATLKTGRRDWLHED